MDVRGRPNRDSIIDMTISVLFGTLTVVRATFKWRRGSLFRLVVHLFEALGFEGSGAGFDLRVEARDTNCR